MFLYAPTSDVSIFVVILGVLVLLCIYWAIKWVVSLWTGA